MSRIDQYIAHAVKMEAKSRIEYFNNNTDLVETNAKVNDNKFKTRMNALKKDIEETNAKLDEMIVQQSNKKQRGDDGFDMADYQRTMSERFPDLRDPRCYTHAMRPVPNEHLFALYDNTDGLGTGLYLKHRWSIPPKERYYFRVPTSWDYGWCKPEPSTEPYHGQTNEIAKYIWRTNGVFITDKQIPVKTFL